MAEPKLGNHELFETLRTGDRVKILIYAELGREGTEWKEATGRVVIRSPGYCALNMGGRYGTPGVCTPDNLVAIVSRKA